jgi:hydroxymethylbilane synthase
MKRRIRIGTRESSLALVQSQLVAGEILKKYPDWEMELVKFKTQGDRLLDGRLDDKGGKGLFVRELENALLDGKIDLAVHSMKDMPAELPEGLAIAAISRREDPRDVLLSRDGRKLEELDTHAVIGTSSLRREALVRQMKPGAETRLLRGNVPTRIAKLESGEYDAIILAMAGLKRLGLEDKCTQCFAVERFVPAAGQGALAIEARAEDDAGYLLRSVHDPETALAVAAEREYMKSLNGGCNTPLGAYAAIAGGKMTLYGFLAAEDLSKSFTEYVEGPAEDALLLGRKLADTMKNRMAGR